MHDLVFARVNSPAPDFLPQLAQLAAGLPPAPRRAANAPPIDRAPATAWPQVDARLATLKDLYAGLDDKIAPLATIAGGQLVEGDVLVADHTPWSYSGELRFRELDSVAAPHFVLVDLEVLAGTFEIAVLASDGGDFVGGRHTQRAGRARVQFPIYDHPVRGVVFRNRGPGETGGRLRVHSAKLMRFDRTSAAAAALRQLLESEPQSAPTDVEAPAGVPATLPLAFHRLLALGRIHEATRVLAAIDDFVTERPGWLDLRLSETLLCCHNEPIAAPEAHKIVEENENTPLGAARIPEHVLDELAWLRAANRSAELVPLHQEILQALATLDLLTVTHPCRLRFAWTREALAATPVRAGALSALFALLVERLRESNPLLEVEVRTTATGTTLEFRSPLDHGALQYRAHSVHGDELHRALHHPACPLPMIEHRLGAESVVRISWASAHAPGVWAQICVERLDPSVIETLYGDTASHGVQLDGTICYKTAPSRSGKRNDLVEEAALLQRLSGTSLAPETLASLRTANGTAMSYRFVPGIMLLAWSARQPSPAAITRTLLNFTATLDALNRRNIQHRDVRAENLLIDETGSVHLLDFDQARGAHDADDFSNEWAGSSVCCGFGGLLGQLNWRASYLRTAGALGFAWELGRFSSANSPGKHSCYYDWRWGGYELRGERPWYLRWDLLRPIFEQHVAPGRFLELGCNLGLLSTHASLAGWQARGVDHNALAVAAADEIASALGAAAQFQTGNLCDPALFAAVGPEHDLVSALSVVHWLPDPAPVENFLSTQRRLLFEGHRAIGDEMDYLRSLGYTQIELLGYSERLRPLLYATRLQP